MRLCILLASVLLCSHALALEPMTNAPLPKSTLTPEEFTNGDGSSMEQAIVILASNSAEGIGAEKRWVTENHPSWKLTKQALVHGDNGLVYDKMSYITPEGETKTLYFNITDFFGKW